MHWKLSWSVVRQFAPLVMLLIGIALAAFALKRTYTAGFEAGKSEAIVMIGAARLQAAMDQAVIQRKLIETERNMRELEQRAAAALEQARTEGEIQVRTVERVIRENPDFAAIERPADLERVRNEQLAAIAAAAARGANTAPELPGSGIPALPAPRTLDRDLAGRDRGG